MAYINQLEAHRKSAAISELRVLLLERFDYNANAKLVGTNGFKIELAGWEGNPFDFWIAERHLNSEEIQEIIRKGCILFTLEKENLPNYIWQKCGNWYIGEHSRIAGKNGTYLMKATLEKNNKNYAKAYEYYSRVDTAYTQKQAAKMALLLDKKEEALDACEKSLSIDDLPDCCLRLNFTKYFEIKTNLGDEWVESTGCLYKRKRGYLLSMKIVNYLMENGDYIVAKNHPNVVHKCRFFELSDKFELEKSYDIVEPEYPINARANGISDVRLINENMFLCDTQQLEEGIVSMCLCKHQEGKIESMKRLFIDKRKHEKNWLHFYKNQKLYFVYSLSPLKICALGEENVYFCGSFTSSDKVDIRGSAGLVPWCGGWLAIGHQVMFYEKYKRNYIHRFMWFDYDFQSSKVSRPFNFTKKGVEFCLSIVAEEQRALITFSVDDKGCFVGEISKGEINRLLEI